MDEILITANDNSIIYDGYINEMPSYGYFVDIFEEYNKGERDGITLNGWKWEIY